MLHAVTVRRSVLLGAVLLAFALPALAAPLRIGVQAGAVKKFAVLESYLQKNGIDAELVGYANGDAAVELTTKGQVDALITGSGLGATLMDKKLAAPLARPVDKQGRSTYWAVVVAPKGSRTFDGSAAYFAGKRIAFTSLASSGEFFFRSLPGSAGVGAKVIEVATHQDAIDKVDKGEADFAIVKNMAWAPVKNKYTGLVEVGSDGGQNPNDTLLVTNRVDAARSKQLLAVLLGVGKDKGAEATALKDGLGIFEYTVTSANDFNHTFSLMRKAGAIK